MLGHDERTQKWRAEPGSMVKSLKFIYVSAASGEGS